MHKVALVWRNLSIDQYQTILNEILSKNNLKYETTSKAKIIKVHYQDDNSFLLSHHHKIQIINWSKTHSSLFAPKPLTSLSELNENDRRFLSKDFLQRQLSTLKIYDYDLVFLQDSVFNKNWIKRWSKRYLISDDEFTLLQKNYGSKVSLYFAFLQFYFIALIPPSLIGFWFYRSGTIFSPIYSVIIVVWGVLTSLLWIRQEKKYALLWNSNDSDQKRVDFGHDKVLIDNVTGERTLYYPFYKRWVTTILVTIPSLLIALSIITLAITLNLIIEVFIHEVYTGPLSSFIFFVPTIVYAISIPYLSSLYVYISRLITKLENHETTSGQDDSLTRKGFLVNFCLNFLNLFLYGGVIIPYYNDIYVYLVGVLGLNVGGGAEKSKDGFDFQDRLFYFIVTGQVINFFTEMVIPVLMAKYTKKKVKEKKATDYFDLVNIELAKPKWDPFEDYNEMIMQFGFIVLFSTSWTLSPLICLINNFIELRSDTLKITKTCRVPCSPPVRSFGPWSFFMIFITWLGALFNVVLVDLYCNDTEILDRGKMLMMVEHVFFLFVLLVYLGLKSMPDVMDKSIEREKFSVANELLENVGIDLRAGSFGGQVEWRGGAKSEANLVEFGIALANYHQQEKIKKV